MTDAKLTARVKWWQRKLSLLGVGHWRTTVSILDCIEPENAQAKVEADKFYDTADFEFRKSAVLAHERDGTLDELIVHEWLHAVDRTQDEIVLWLLEQLSPAAREVTETREEAARERRIDNLSRLIVKLVHSSEPNKES